MRGGRGGVSSLLGSKAGVGIEEFGVFWGELFEGEQAICGRVAPDPSPALGAMKAETVPGGETGAGEEDAGGGMGLEGFGCGLPDTEPFGFKQTGEEILWGLPAKKLVWKPPPTEDDTLSVLVFEAEEDVPGIDGDAGDGKGFWNTGMDTVEGVFLHSGGEIDAVGEDLVGVREGRGQEGPGPGAAGCGAGGPGGDLGGDLGGKLGGELGGEVVSGGARVGFGAFPDVPGVLAFGGFPGEGGHGAVEGSEFEPTPLRILFVDGDFPLRRELGAEGMPGEGTGHQCRVMG